MGSAHHRGLKSSWGWVWIFPKKDRGVGNLSTLQSHHFSCSWKARLYCVAAPFVFTKRWKSSLVLPSRDRCNSNEIEGWISCLLSPMVFPVPQGHGRARMCALTHCSERAQIHPCVCCSQLGALFFKQILPGELGLACSQCLGGDLSCGCCCMDCVFDKDKAVMASSPQPAFPTPNKKLVFLRRNTSGEILYYCILHREYSAMTQIVAFCNIFLIKQ